MKTTIELPDELMRAVKIRAIQTNRKLKDFITDALRKALAEPAKPPAYGPLDALRRQMVFHEDGKVTNPDGVDDRGFFDELEEIRRCDEAEPARKPFAGH